MNHHRTFLFLLLSSSLSLRCAPLPNTPPQAPPRPIQDNPLSPPDAVAPQQRNAQMAKQDTPARDAIPQMFKWNTTHLFADDEAWAKERQLLVDSSKDIADCQGKLKQGKKMVKACLDRVFEARRRLARLAAYANRKCDEDTRVAKYQGLKEVMDKISTDFLSLTAFIQPELLSLPEKTLQEMVKDKTFADYDQYLREMLHLKPHILSPQEEKLLAAASLMRDSGINIYSSFTGADLTFPTIVDEEGKTVQLTQALFSRYRAVASRKVRKATFEALFSRYTDYKNTLAALLSAQINANVVYAKERHYDSALEAALDGDTIPTAVYHNMIKAVNKHLPLLHRYLRLRQKLLGLKELRYYDMYPPITQKVDLEYPHNRANQQLLAALGPLGKNYLAALAHGLDPQHGWIDSFPNLGKRSGAYMDGSAYDIHPYVLTNYLGDYNSLSTLAHEMGHAMHSYFTNKHQPYSKSNYSTFVAEVASTLNEALLMKHMQTNEKKRTSQLYLLGEQLESFRQTLFRQAMFAEFELALYQRAEKKEALTADEISKIYLQIARRYYGHDQGVVQVDDLYGIEWAYVPHFYYNFYVFQYVTGITASTALAEMILKEGDPARDRYLTQMLEAGGSDYPIQILQRAGVDLTTTKPYDIAMGVFSRALDRAELLVSEREKKEAKKEKKKNKQ
jgi:oligoendopeptidase F